MSTYKEYRRYHMASVKRKVQTIHAPPLCTAYAYRIFYRRQRDVTFLLCGAHVVEKQLTSFSRIWSCATRCLMHRRMRRRDHRRDDTGSLCKPT